MTPEQACDVLVRAGVLQKIDSKHNPYAFRFPYGGSWPFSDAEQAIDDGNVAMAAWDAIVTKFPGSWYVVQDDRTMMYVRDMCLDEHLKVEYRFSFDGTDSAAITTACAMALKAMEDGDE